MLSPRKWDPKMLMQEALHFMEKQLRSREIVMS